MNPKYRPVAPDGYVFYENAVDLKAASLEHRLNTLNRLGIPTEDVTTAIHDLCGEPCVALFVRDIHAETVSRYTREVTALLEAFLFSARGDL